MFKLIIAHFLIFIFSYSFVIGSVKDDPRYFKVKRVIDGDTFVIVDRQHQDVKVRLIGVDAPETRKTRKKPVGYYGQESKAYLKKLIDQKTVQLVFDVGKKDQYGRWLSYVYVNRTFVNADLVKKGYAVTYTVPPNVKYAEYFVKLEQKARIQEMGLWKYKNL
ncbi:thermonuclease family protein [Sphingobacterium sp. PCS056]|uniref:thermonuclease family protein n=1 Tax=Sphingobacterium sp. PCS056 TaxID=2931400 RepID=UPI00200E1DB8|nr:thermonuclease family protein [Sphingobacterium sp. PCS056]UPZ34822.1 thermonuclease family protein [Sphingobacterium sp. PCS056]